MPTSAEQARFEKIRALYLRERAVEEQRLSAQADATFEVLVEGAPSEEPDTSVSNEGATDAAIDAARPDFGKEGQPKGPSREVQVEAAAQLESAALSDEIDESLLLDVYWANYGDASMRAFLRNQPTDTSVLEVVIGEDNRVEVQNTRDYPWRCICSLRITSSDGSGWIGTGWLVGPRTVITAGHCVYIHDRGGWVKRIDVIPGRKGAEWPYGSCVSTSFRAVTGWTQNRDRNFDYAAILLPADCRIGDTLGWFGYAARNDSDLQSNRVNISGYPGDKPGSQWFHSNTLSSISDRILTYTIDTSGGQSGAPVWISEANRGGYGVGIHTNGAITGNSATRINHAVFDNIKLWKSHTP